MKMKLMVFYCSSNVLQHLYSIPVAYDIPGLQWNPSITDTIGIQHFVCYSEVSRTQGFPVHFW